MEYQSAGASNSVSMEQWVEALMDIESDHMPEPAILPSRPNRAPCTADELQLPQTMGGPQPTVSVVIPTYQDSEYLPDAIQSVAAQTHQDLEVVIVDSGRSTWIDALASERDWLCYVPTKPNGVSAARNDGIEHATGEYIAFLDVDDYWHPQKLEAQLAAMGTSHRVSYTGYVFLNYWRGTSPSISFEDIDAISTDSAARALIARAIDAHTSTLLCSADIVPDRPFNESLENFEDVVFAIERFREHAPVHVERPLAVRRLRPGSLADRTDDREKACYRIEAYKHIAEEYPEYSADTEGAIAQEQYRIGVLDVRSGHLRSARSQFRRAIRHRPISAIACYLMTFLPVDVGALLDRGARLT